ncbi:unnamed protein product [Lactuca saligna]|uniref:Uncharacterized protein n=1 Tax=Lactuca saligna TaxID=75948 RepID=A0AA35V667_LACSI|nr:unnamed protein product [Lactuca saligna]
MEEDSNVESEVSNARFSVCNLYDPMPEPSFHVYCHPEHARASTSQILDVGTTAKVTTTRFLRIDEDHDQTRMIIDFLQEDVTTA